MSKINLTAAQLEAAAGHPDPNDAVLVNMITGETSIADDVDDLTPYQRWGANPKYVCRVEAVRTLVQTWGVEQALVHINRNI